MIKYAFLLFSILQCLPNTFAQSLTITRLKCDYKVNPMGIASPAPRLSWQLRGDGRNQSQSAWQIQVATDEMDLRGSKNLYWDSKKRYSNQSILVSYQGAKLQSGQRYYWRVKIWDERDKASSWSEVAYWEMGLLDSIDWQAQWIEPAWPEETDKSPPVPMLRREFELNKSVESARIYITTHGLYEAYLNGNKIGNQLFTPGWTSYGQRLQYQMYEVTHQLQEGTNALGVMLGDGWYRGNIGWISQRNFYGDRLGLLLQLEVTYTDGSKEVVTSDKHWKATTGPILWSDIYNGESYDARLEKSGWKRPAYDDTGWQPVQLAKYSLSNIIASEGPPVKWIKGLAAERIIRTPKGEWVFDFGQNLVGTVFLTATGSAGTKIQLEHAEVLDEEGNFYTENLRYAKQEVSYIMKGEGKEQYTPFFSFQGFRYIKVDGWPGEPKLGDLVANVIHSDMPITGDFECSEPLLNQLQDNIQWGQRGNFLDVPTDCPQRDERLGWTGDAQAFSATAAFNMDVAGFFTKWLKDLYADQYSNGAVPWVIPHVLAKRSVAAAGWADAATIIPWDMYVAYGDTQILESQYASMKAWVGYMEEQAGADTLWDQGFHFGDWLFYSPADDRDGKAAITDKYLIAQAFFAHSTALTMRTAQVLDKPKDVAYYSTLLQKVKAAFLNEFVTPSGRLVSGTQTAYVLALLFDLLPEDQRQAAADRLVENIERYDDHLTTGFLGTPHLCKVLTAYGYSEVAYALLQQETYPSWLYPVTKGATTIWERWDGIKPDGTLQNPGMNSFNHYAYGAIGNWMYRTIAGIQLDERQPGYKHVMIQPLPGGSLNAAKAWHEGPYGKIVSDWKITEGQFHLEVRIPVNSSATIKLPYTQLNVVKLFGEPISQSKNTLALHKQSEGVVIKVGSGNYRFSYPAVGIEANRKTYTLAYRLGDLLKDRTAYKLLHREIPALRKHPHLDTMKKMYLPELLSAYELECKVPLAELENDLRKIRIKK